MLSGVIRCSTLTLDGIGRICSTTVFGLLINDKNYCIIDEDVTGLVEFGSVFFNIRGWEIDDLVQFGILFEAKIWENWF